MLPPVAEPRFAALAGAVARERARAAARGRLEIPGGAFVAGAVGKLDRGRGHDLVLRALASTPDAWGLIVGHGPAERALRSLAARLGVAGRTVFAGYVDRGLEELYAAMDVHVFPAAGSDHGHRAIAEAAACGVPSLAADLPGVSDLVDDGVSGELYPAEDAAALGVLLLRWGGDAGCRRRAAAAALRRAAQWTPDRLAGAALELYAACGA